MLPSTKSLFDRAMESRDPALAEEALRDFDSQLRSTESLQKRASLLFGKAVLYGVLKRFDDARKQMNITLQEAPEDCLTRLMFDFISGDLDDDEGKPKEAYEHLTEALAKHAKYLDDPANRIFYESAQMRRGFSLFLLNRFEEAVPILQQVLSFKLLPSKRSAVLARLGLCYGELKEWQKARDCLEEACKIGVTSESAWQVHYGLGVVYAYLRLLSESKREFQMCEEHMEEYAAYGLQVLKVYDWLSRICKALGEKAEAEHYARLALPA
jgi:tetratricopeptide (TPR) repeat protein